MGRLTARLFAAIAVAALCTVGIIHCYKRYIEARPELDPDSALYPMRGIDVSAHNGDIDFGRVHSDGYDFVFIKATEGTDFKDRKFVDNWRDARQAGMLTGAYHFFRFDTDGALQATNFINSVAGRRLDFPLVIDVEEWGNPDIGETSKIVDNLSRMIGRLEYFGYDVMLYTNPDAYDRFLRERLSGYPIWLCSLSDLEAPIDWKIWQYSHRGRVDGIEGKVDLNTIKADFLR